MRKHPNRRNGVKILLTSIALASFTCAFTTISDKDDEPTAKAKPTVRLAHLNPQPDSVTVSLLGKDVADIVFGAKKATLSHLNPMEPPTDGDVTIGGVKVAKCLGTLNKTDITTLHFLMADSIFYNQGVVSATSPFSPNYAISFEMKKHKVDMIFSLNSGEIGIVKDGKLSKVVRYNRRREITRFFRLVSQNEFYDNVIANQ